MATSYAQGGHLKVLLGYLDNIERLASHAMTKEDWQLFSVELLDNCHAAQELLKCMV